MSSELEELQRSQGAQFARFEAVALPARFSAVSREWTAVRQRSGLLDARFRGLLRMIGSDRITFLQGMVSNDVAALHDGEGTYAALLTIQGKLVSDLRVYRLPEDLWLDVPAARVSAVRQALEAFIVADDVEFAPDDWAPLLALEGPQAARTVVGVFGEDVEGLAPFAHREALFDGTPVRIAAASHSGERGYLIFASPAIAASMWQRCQAAGAEPVGMEALDVLRLEAGIPWYGRDMNDSMLIGEVGLEAAISYRKGCYLGQEVVERLAARGQVHRRLVGLLCEGEEVPPPQSKLIHDGKEVGWITSAASSPARQHVIALGYARRELSEPGAEVQIALAQATTTARVEPLPFYTRPS